MSASGNHNVHKLSTMGLLVTLGIIYGDIGTSPLYVMKAIVGDRIITEDLIYGGLSLVFWTLTIQTTFKYVFITLRADNKGEGGIFALFTLVRRRYPILIWPAMIGGASMLADGIITPPISISSAIEGLTIKNPDFNTMPVVIAILVGLFVAQRFGTKTMGSSFGPIMLVWFSMLGVLGFLQIIENPDVLRAFNPYYAYNFLANYPGAFWLLSAVFLCTTGAEALYSDLGHCGRENIRVSWLFVKTTLLLNYFGQGAWLMTLNGQHLNQKPLYAIMPDWFLPFGILISTMAAVIASQSMLTGSFTLISEAIKLNVWPKVRINYPTTTKGQLYIPSINWLLFAGCIFVTIIFQKSENMEGAYGLAISLTMIMSTMLLMMFLYIRRVNKILIVSLFLLLLIVEYSFLIANLEKFFHGGYVTFVIGGGMFAVMWIWMASKKIKNRLTEMVPLDQYHPMLMELSHDMSVPKYATHLVYLTSSSESNYIESKIMYSIFNKQPKRADVYWLLHVDVVDEPYRMEYKVDVILPNDLVRVDFKLGFRVETKINLYFRKVVEDMLKNKEIDFSSRYTSLKNKQTVGDFKFVVLEKHLSNDNDLSPADQIIMDGYFALKHVSMSESSAFGLDTSSVLIEKVPLVIAPKENFELTRIR